MKRIVQLVSVALMMALVSPISSVAQSRPANGRPSNSSASRPTAVSRPSSSAVSRPVSSAVSRPVSSSTNHVSAPAINNNRPGNSGNHNNNGNHNNGTVNRPGNNGNNGNHNGVNNGNHNNGNHNGNNNFRPTTPGNNPTRPGFTGNNNNWRPGTSAPRPGAVSHPVPVRPYMPVNRPYNRPTPPAGWRPYYGAPTFSSILGLTFGTALNISINSLINAGYSVASYGANTIYLNSVPMFNVTWPNATLYYNNGSLYGSEFVYSTPYYDMSRFNQLYNNLMAQYGQPVSVSNNGNSVSATWWGYNNGYVTLNYFNDYAQNGTLRYYTTLSVGN